MSQKAFKDENELMSRFNDYIKHCQELEKLPNIAGFCRFADIGRSTFYEQSNYYSDTVKKIDMILEDEAINCKSVNDTFKIFYMKNKFSEDYRDRYENTVSVSSYDITEDPD